VVEREVGMHALHGTAPILPRGNRSGDSLQVLVLEIVRQLVASVPARVLTLERGRLQGA